MELKHNVTGSDRKRLVAALSEIMEVSSKYLGAPTFAYEVDYFTIDKTGNVSFDDRADSDEVEMLVERLLELGFQPEGTKSNVIEVEDVCISMPRNFFSKTTLDNLNALITAKGGLIREALGFAELPVELTEDKVSFPWFVGQPTPEELKTYDHFICALCEMARNQKRITVKEKDTGNDKYAFRCFLLRLGFIGAEYKEQRKILLCNLTGSSAYAKGEKAIAQF